MRKKLIAGNWKLNTTRNEALALAESVSGTVRRDDVDVAIFPPFVWLEAVARSLSGSTIGVGAQDCAAEKTGAFTGQVSAFMISEMCSWVIVGHSERRRDACESDQLIGRKAAVALAAGLRPIVCVGEDLAARETDQHERIVGSQIEAVLAELTAMPDSGIVFAYEPIWAIGTGRSASPHDAQRMATFIRRRITSSAGYDSRVLYGGSVVAENAASYLAEPDVDGLLVGGASLRSGEFLKIIAAC